jgi:hypothetical protein
MWRVWHRIGQLEPRRLFGGDPPGCGFLFAPRSFRTRALQGVQRKRIAARLPVLPCSGCEPPRRASRTPRGGACRCDQPRRASRGLSWQPMPPPPSRRRGAGLLCPSLCKSLIPSWAVVPCRFVCPL